MAQLAEKNCIRRKKKKYLGTFRERVIVALSESEVLSKKLLPELTQKMKENPDAKVLLNGSLDYMMLRPYIKLAEETNHEFSIVQREVGETDIFLVLAAKQEVDIENIQLEKNS